MSSENAKKYVFCGDWVSEYTVGVQRYAMQLLLELDRRLDAGEITDQIILLVPENASWTSPFQKIQVVRKGSNENKIKKYIWQQWVFPRFVRSQKAVGIDLTLALPVWGCDVYAIHDCIVEKYPENLADHKLFRRLYLAKLHLIAKRRHCRFLTVSECSKKDIISYYHIEPDRIDVVPDGWEHMQAIEPDMTIFDRIPEIKEGHYFFSLGSKYRHKNIRWILQAARRNPETYFVITGSNAFSREHEHLETEKPDNVIFTGYLSDGEMKALMAHCRALIQPSFYEGFGIPPLEALSLGKDIIIAKASCFPEIYGETAYYIDPTDADIDLETLLSQRKASPTQVLERYSWHRAAALLMEALDMRKA